MDKFMSNLIGASWRSSLIGFLLAVITYFYNLGDNLPSSGHDWLGAAMAAGIFAFSKVVKDWNVTNATFVSPAAVRAETAVPEVIAVATAGQATIMKP